MTEQRFVDALEYFLKEDGGGVLSVRGAWGVGKTHFWNNEVESKLCPKDHQKMVYISLFGVGSISEIESKLIAKRLSNIAMKKINSRLKQVMTWIENRFFKLLQYLPDSKGKWVKLANNIHIDFCKHLVICLDDIERKSDSLSLKEVFGFIDRMRESNECKVVAIFSENYLTENKKEGEIYKKFREKIFDKELTYITSPSEACDIALAGDKDIGIYVHHICEKIKIVNIRLIKKIISRIEEILKYVNGIDHDQMAKEQICTSLSIYNWVLYEHGIKVLNYISKNSNLSFNDYKKSRENRPKYPKVHKKLESIGYLYTDDLDRVLIDYTKSGFIDKDGLRKHVIDVSEKFEITRVSNNYNAVWSQFYSSIFEYNEDEVAEAFKKFFMDNAKLLSIYQLDETIGLLRDIGKSDIANDLISHFIAENIDTPEKFVADSFYREIKDDVLNQNLEKNIVPPPSKTILEALEQVATGDWSGSDTATLNSATVDDCIKFLDSIDGNDECTQLIQAGLRLQDDFSEALTKALKIKAAESRINRIRVKNLFKISPDNGNDESKSS